MPKVYFIDPCVSLAYLLERSRVETVATVVTKHRGIDDFLQQVSHGG